MNNVNGVASSGTDNQHENAVTIPLTQEVADRFRKSPLLMWVIFYSYWVAVLASIIALAFMHPQNAQQYRAYGLFAFLLTFLLRIVLRKAFLGRAIGIVSDELTSRLGQSAAFRKIVYQTLAETPWSKFRIGMGRMRYKAARFEDIMVLFRDGSHTKLTIAEDFSSVSIVPPSRII